MRRPSHHARPARTHLVLVAVRAMPEAVLPFSVVLWSAAYAPTPLWCQNNEVSNT